MLGLQSMQVLPPQGPPLPLPNNRPIQPHSNYLEKSSPYFQSVLVFSLAYQ